MKHENEVDWFTGIFAFIATILVCSMSIWIYFNSMRIAELEKRLNSMEQHQYTERTAAPAQIFHSSDDG